MYINIDVYINISSFDKTHKKNDESSKTLRPSFRICAASIASTILNGSNKRIISDARARYKYNQTQKK